MYGPELIKNEVNTSNIICHLLNDSSMYEKHVKHAFLQLV